MASAPDSRSTPIAELAVELEHQLPALKALDALDFAMRDHPAGEDDFETGGPEAQQWRAHLEPPSAFAELLRKAFAPDMDPRELALVAMADKTDDPEVLELVRAAGQRWQWVVDRFAERYRLWGRKPA